MSAQTQPVARGGLLRRVLEQERLLVWMVAGAAVATGIAILVQRHYISAIHPLFWDLPVYVAAVNAYALGLDPYDSAVLHRLGAPTSFHFTSPPTVALLFRLIAGAGMQGVFGSLLLAAHLVAIIVLPVALGRLFFGRSADRLALAFGAMVMLYEAAGTSAFGAANNGTLLYCAIALTAISGFQKDRWLPFLVTVFVATLFKPFYLAFLAVPALAHGFSWRLAIHGALTGLAAITVYGLFALLDPASFSNWLGRLSEQSTGPYAIVGRNIFGGLLAVMPDLSQGIAAVAQLAYVVALGAAFLLTNPSGRLRWAFLLTAAIFANPRLASYDDSVAAIPLVFAAATLLPRSLPTGIRLALTVAVLSPLLLVPTYRTIALVPAGLLFPLATLGIFIWAAFAQRRDPVGRS